MSSFIDAVQSRQPLMWRNPRWRPAAEALPRLPLGPGEVLQADALLRRWAPALARCFPELEAQAGLIESPLSELPVPEAVLGHSIPGRVWLKHDHALPVAGSIKARGGIFEVLTIAEWVMRAEGIAWSDPLRPLAPDVRAVFSRYGIAVGSTGNLGLAIGVMASALGFHSEVHMSRDAKSWKKARLRARGVVVVEHEGDFAAAVAAGRAEAARHPESRFFVDDERSEALFLGYATAALRLREQLAAAAIAVDAAHPLFVYLPCGVGGAPGGITFGLRQLFGDAVHCFFAEPCASPSMLLSLALERPGVTVYDLGLDNVTEADGLAVGCASELARDMMLELVSGIFTVRDDDMFRHLYRLRAAAGMAVEPSAAAGFAGPAMLLGSKAGREYLAQRGLDAHLPSANHVVWTTGGAFVPAEEYRHFFNRGKALLTADGAIPPFSIGESI